MNKTHYLLLLIITASGLFLRTIYLPSNPPGFFCDEAAIGYNAYCLLKTGQDEHQVSWPTFFRSFGEYKDPVAVYSALPFVAVLGLNELAVRLPAALYGTAAIAIIYFLGKKLFSPQIGLLSAFLLAVSPWHLHFSRIGFIGLPAFVFFVSLSLLLFLHGLRKKHLLPISFLLFAISTYTYSPARVFVPLFVLLLAMIYWPQLTHSRRDRFRLALSFSILLIVSIPLILHTVKGQGLIRASQIAIFSFSENYRLIFTHIISKYLLSFSPQLLFLHGDAGMSSEKLLRHSVPGTGELFWFQLPLLLIGLTVLWKKRQHPFTLTLLSWLLLFPVADSLTIDFPSASHLIIGVIPLQIICALGLKFILDKTSKISLHSTSTILAGLITLLLSGAVIFESSRYLGLYYNQYPLEAAGYWGRQYGPREIVSYFTEVEDEYDELIMSDRFNAPDIFFKFYAPESCQNCLIGNLDNYDPNINQLFALRPEQVPIDQQLDVKKKIYYPNSKLAFIIGEL